MTRGNLLRDSFLCSEQRHTGYINYAVVVFSLFVRSRILNERTNFIERLKADKSIGLIYCAQPTIKYIRKELKQNDEHNIQCFQYM